MGVSGFSSFVKRRYPSAYRELPPDEGVDHLYIDLASTLHQTVRKARTRAYFHNLLWKRLDAILAACKPRKRVVIALDGPAPLAKLLEQRRRRRREADRAQRSGPGGSASSSQAVSSLMLTTGTPLMLEVHQSLAYYICKALADPATEHLEFELSDSTVKGEGEVKILHRILQHYQSLQDGNGADTPDSHMILGCDSDLLVMAMVSGLPRLYICDDSQDFEVFDPQYSQAQCGLEPGSAEGIGLEGGEGGGVASEGPGLALHSGSGVEAAISGARVAAAGSGVDVESSGDVPSGLRVFSRDALAAQWAEEHFGGQELSSSVTIGLALDLALLAIMCGGNDYLPGMQGLQLVCKHRPGLWDLYLEMRQEPGTWSTKRRRLVRRWPGRGGVARVDINREALGELLQRYHDRRAMAAMLSFSSDTEADEGEEGGLLSSGEEDEGEDEEEKGEEGLWGEGERQLGRWGRAKARRQRWRWRRRDAAVEREAARQALAQLGQAALKPPRLHSNPNEALAVIEAGEAELAALPEPLPPPNKRPGWRPAQRNCACACDQDCSPRRHKQHSTHGEADSEEYLEGLKWVLRMYCRGQVTDYRWTYDMAAPSLQDMLCLLRCEGAGADAAEAAVGTAESGRGAAEAGEGQRGEGKRGEHQHRQPLLPAACALALLPFGGRTHAPTALQHLMDPGSPLEDIYAVCPSCAGFGRQISIVNRDLHRVRRQLSDLRQVLDQVWVAIDAGGDKPEVAAEEERLRLVQGLPTSSEWPWAADFSLEHEAARLQAAIRAREEAEEELKLTLGRLSRVQQDHHAASHPYKPFPTADLEAAVAAVPLNQHPWRERRLLKFGRDLLFSRRKGASMAAEQAQQQQEQQQNAEGFGQQLGPTAAAGSDVAAQDIGLPGIAALPAEQLLDKADSEQGQGQQDAAAAVKEAANGPARVLPDAWLRECAAFCNFYSRWADPSILASARARGVMREALPLTHYLRPPTRLASSSIPGGSRSASGGGGKGGGVSRGRALPSSQAHPGPSPGGSGPMAVLQLQQARQYSGCSTTTTSWQLLRQCMGRARLLRAVFRF